MLNQMVRLFAMLSLLVLCVPARAQGVDPIACVGATSDGASLDLNIRGQGGLVVDLQVNRMPGGWSLQRQYRGANLVWDGHRTGLVTASGFSLRFDRDFGRYSNARAMLRLPARDSTSEGPFDDIPVECADQSGVVKPPGSIPSPIPSPRPTRRPCAFCD